MAQLNSAVDEHAELEKLLLEQGWDRLDEATTLTEFMREELQNNDICNYVDAEDTVHKEIRTEKFMKHDGKDLLEVDVEAACAADSELQKAYNTCIDNFCDMVLKRPTRNEWTSNKTKSVCFFYRAICDSPKR